MGDRHDRERALADLIEREMWNALKQPCPVLGLGTALTVTHAAEAIAETWCKNDFYVSQAMIQDDDLYKAADTIRDNAADGYWANRSYLMVAMARWTIKYIEEECKRSRRDGL